MDIKDLGPAALIFVFFAVVATIGLNITSTVQGDFVTGAAGCNSTARTACGYDYNATQEGIEGLDELAGWLPVIALVVAAAIVIGVLLYIKT